MLNGLLSQAEGLGVFALLGGALGLLVFFVSGLVFTQLSGGLTVRIAVAHAAGMFIHELLIQAHTFGGRRVAGKQTSSQLGFRPSENFKKVPCSFTAPWGRSPPRPITSTPYGRAPS